MQWLDNLEVALKLESCVDVQASRDRIFNCEDDPSEMHRLLTNLPPLEGLSADELAQQAVALYRRSPPKLLLKRYHMRMLT